MDLRDILTACILVVLVGYAVTSLIFRYMEVRKQEKSKAEDKENKQLLNE